MNRPLDSARLFTSKQYLARAVEYGDLAKTSIGSTKRQEFLELEGRFSVLEVLADNDELLQEKRPFVALSRTRQIERPLQPRIRFCDVLELRLLCNGICCPAKLQRELFDNAGDIGELLDTSGLRGQIALFLHIHKDDESNAGDKEMMKLNPGTREAVVAGVTRLLDRFPHRLERRRE